MVKQIICIGTLLLMGFAHAGPSEDARAHFEAIAANNIENTMHNYADQASFDWVGGPLDGIYKGNDAIKGVWEKFFKGLGPLNAKVDNIKFASNPKGSTVTAQVQFEGKKTLKILYVITYKNGKITNEIWQNDAS